jgi:hypothetical protein
VELYLLFVTTANLPRLNLMPRLFTFRLFSFLLPKLIVSVIPFHILDTHQKVALLIRTISQPIIRSINRQKKTFPAHLVHLYQLEFVQIVCKSEDRGSICGMVDILTQHLIQ